MREGTILWFDKKKGYGFIKCTTEALDIFVHYSDFVSPLKTLDEGDKVVFEILRGEKGFRAGKVILAKTPDV